MQDLKDILQKSLIDDSIRHIRIDFAIPRLSLIVFDSRQMLLYGIGLDRKPGFTLCVDAPNTSKEDGKIIARLQEGEILSGFKTFAERRRLWFLKDFGIAVDALTKEALSILEHLTAYGFDGTYKITTFGTGDIAYLE